MDAVGNLMHGLHIAESGTQSLERRCSKAAALPNPGPFPEIDETRDQRDGKAVAVDISHSRSSDF
jgi:hypothetical protein